MIKKKDYNKLEKDDEAFEKHKFNFVKNALRIATYKWPYFSIAMSKARVERGMYKCGSCSQVFGPKQINRDHIQPVIDVQHGFTTWTDYINRLFIKSDGIQILCINCHALKSATENHMRAKYGQKLIKVNKKRKIKLRKLKI